jgi:hypothetical protein
MSIERWNALVSSETRKKPTLLSGLRLPFFSFLKLGQVLKTAPGSAGASGSDTGVTGKLKAGSPPSLLATLGVSGVGLYQKSRFTHSHSYLVPVSEPWLQFQATQEQADQRLQASNGSLHANSEQKLAHSLTSTAMAAGATAGTSGASLIASGWRGCVSEAEDTSTASLVSEAGAKSMAEISD